MNHYAAHADRIRALCDWIISARTRQAVVARYESSVESAVETYGDLRRLRLARRLALSIIAHQTIRVAGSRED